ncbi:hypothetical protein [Brassicibacter mesophilus]|uniref:hypothetical protein n=1 Tax=Brassicibacter mesophilus TaxID=745119 RepID=UPI003D1F9672
MLKSNRKIIAYIFLFVALILIINYSFDYLYPRELKVVLQNNNLINKNYNIVKILKDKGFESELQNITIKKSEEAGKMKEIEQLLHKKVKRVPLFFAPDYYSVEIIYDFAGYLNFSVRGKRYLEITDENKTVFSKKKSKHYKYIFCDEKFNFEDFWLLLK